MDEGDPGVHSRLFQCGKTGQGDNISDNITSQAASNNSDTVPQPYEGGCPNTNPEPLGSDSEFRDIREESSNQEPKQSHGADDTDQVESSFVSTPTTIMFDLNSASEEDEGDQGLTREICDLSLNLAIPMTASKEQSEVPPTVGADPELEEIILDSGNSETQGGLSQASCPVVIMSTESRE